MDAGNSLDDGSAKGKDGNEHINKQPGQPPTRGTTSAEPEGEQPPEMARQQSAQGTNGVQRE
eukprot:679357-Prorocentrum_lima.AAC.1